MNKIKTLCQDKSIQFSAAFFVSLLVLCPSFAFASIGGTIEKFKGWIIAIIVVIGVAWIGKMVFDNVKGSNGGSKGKIVGESIFLVVLIGLAIFVGSFTSGEGANNTAVENIAGTAVNSLDSATSEAVK